MGWGWSVFCPVVQPVFSKTYRDTVKGSAGVVLGIFQRYPRDVLRDVLTPYKVRTSLRRPKDILRTW
jgi:hypothetical protein